MDRQEESEEVRNSNEWEGRQQLEESEESNELELSEEW